MRGELELVQPHGPAQPVWGRASLLHPLQVRTDAGEGVCGDSGEWSHDQGPGWLHPWPQQVCALGYRV